jgi:DNA-binding sugar fermentation-stimulating protein
MLPGSQIGDHGKETLGALSGRTALRGRKDLERLAAAQRGGVGAAIRFVIQRGDAEAFAPNWSANPEFSEVLCRAWRARVHVGALNL